MFRNASMLELSLFGKSIMASVLLLIVLLQVVAIGVGRGWIGYFPPKVREKAVKVHRFQGYVGLIIILFVAYNCVFVWALPKAGSPRVLAHSLLGTSVLMLIMVKIVINRVFQQFYTQLPKVGVTLALAITALWFTGAGWYFYTFGWSY